MMNELLELAVATHGGFDRLAFIPQRFARIVGWWRSLGPQGPSWSRHAGNISVFIQNWPRLSALSQAGLTAPPESLAGGTKYNV